MLVQTILSDLNQLDEQEKMDIIRRNSQKKRCKKSDMMVMNELRVGFDTEVELLVKKT